jgi:hypothetical protein
MRKASAKVMREARLFALVFAEKDRKRLHHHVDGVDIVPDHNADPTAFEVGSDCQSQEIKAEFIAVCVTKGRPLQIKPL